MPLEPPTRILLELFRDLPELNVSVVGTGAAQFVYAKTAERAIELSPDGDRYFFEAWDTADEESDDGPVISRTVDDLEERRALLREWLGG